MLRLATLLLVVGQLSCGGVAQVPAPPGFVVEAGDARVTANALRSVDGYVQQGLARMASAFPGMPSRPFRVMVHSDGDSLPMALRENLHPGTAGFARLGRDEMRVLLRESLQEPPNDLRTVVRHELVHVLLDQFVGDASAGVPRWVHEGLAQALSGQAYLRLGEEDLVFAVSTRSMPRFSTLEAEFPARDDLLRLAYAQSFSFVAYLVDRFGIATVVEAARASAAAGSFDRALLDRTEISLAVLQDDWENYVVFRSGAIARYLLRHCSSLAIVLAVPLLVIAAMKRIRHNRWRKAQLAAEDEQRLLLPPLAPDSDLADAAPAPGEPERP